MKRKSLLPLMSVALSAILMMTSISGFSMLVVAAETESEVVNKTESEVATETESAVAAETESAVVTETESNSASSETGSTDAGESESSFDLDSFNQLHSAKVLKKAESLVEEAKTALQNDQTQKIQLADDSTTVSGPGVTVKKNKVTISAPGYYEISGSLSDGQIIVESDGEVVLILNNVTIHNDSKECIKISKVDHCLIYLMDGTTNELQSGEAVEITDASDNESLKDAEGAALYSKSDLSIGGNGKMIVGGYVNNGIATKDALVLLSGEVEIKSLNHGLKGKDSVTISGGTCTILSGNDGIKSTNDEKEGRGRVDLLNGTVIIHSYGDGIQTEQDFWMQDGVLQILNGYSDAEEFQVNTRGDSDKKDQTKGSMGIYSGGSVTICGGSIEILSGDDGIHSKENVTFDGGTIQIIAADDAVHANDIVTLRDGQITIQEAYEGLEGHLVDIQGGSLTIHSYDDGINAGGSSSSEGVISSASNGTKDEGSSSTEGEDSISTGEETSVTGIKESMESSEVQKLLPSITISGGEIYVDADGDGLDSNGDITLNGGSLIVECSPDGQFNSLDCGSENGGVLLSNGGTVLALGRADRAKGFDDSSSQASFIQSFEEKFEAGTQIRILDSESKVLMEYTTTKSFNSVIFSCPQLTSGQKITLEVGNTTQELTING